MTDSEEKLLSAFDGHNVDGVRNALASGANASSPIKGKLPVYWLLEEYTRSDKVKECLRLLFANGAVLDDPRLVPVLLDDAVAINEVTQNNDAYVRHRTTLVSAFTSLVDVSLLHVAAEYGHLAAAEALIEAGADVDAKAGVDEFGFGGHTPLFHTVNSNANRSASIMKLLVEAGADVSSRVNGLYWGRGYPWETVFFDVTPISFAQMGLLPQVHRREQDIYPNIEYLMTAALREMPPLNNVPNRYLG